MADGIDKLPSGKWRSRYLGPDGKRYTKTFSLKRDAQYWRASELRAAELGQWTSPSKRRADHLEVPTVHSYAVQCIDRRASRSRKPLAPTTVDNYRKLVRLTLDGTELGDMELTSASRADIAQWRWSLPATTQSGKAYEFLVSVFKDAMRDELITSTPCTLQGAGAPERRREPQALSPSEVEALVAALPPQWRLPILLSATCGLRIGEVLALTVRDLDVVAQAVTVRRSVAKVQNGDGTQRLLLKSPKTAASQRTVALLPHTVPAVVAFLSGLQPVNARALRVHDDQGRPLYTVPTFAAFLAALDPNALLFHDGYGRPVNDGRVRRYFIMAAATIGRPDLRLHDLRSTALTLSGQAGATVHELQTMAGHTTATVAMRYQRSDAQRDRERASRVSSAWSGTRTRST